MLGFDFECVRIDGCPERPLGSSEVAGEILTFCTQAIINLYRSEIKTMSQKFIFIRIFFAAAAMIAFAAYFGTVWEFTPYSIALGVIAGGVLTIFLTLCEKISSAATMRRATVVVCFGLGLGYLLAQTLLTILTNTTLFTDLRITHLIVNLVCAYIGLVAIDRAAAQIELWLTGASVSRSTTSAPLAAGKKKGELASSAAAQQQQERRILPDTSALADPRIIDLAASGILDDRLTISKAILTELYNQADNEEDPQKTRARRALDAIKKLEAIPSLQIHYSDFEPNIASNDGSCHAFTIAVAKELHASILTADISRLQQTAVDSVRIINLNDLSNALKPLMQAGEVISIKVQRYGKEPRQGVGYLEDGTMVVVNGGATYIGETIQAHVLSVKHSSTGARMIFCNAIEEDLDESPLLHESSGFPSMIKRSIPSNNNFCTL